MAIFATSLCRIDCLCVGFDLIVKGYEACCFWFADNLGEVRILENVVFVVYIGEGIAHLTHLERLYR